MKKISMLLALVALLAAQVVLARGVVTSIAGAVQVQRGIAAPVALRLGDQVNQADTLSTGPNSSVVVKFDDGQIAALTANSRMTVSAYQFDPQTRSGNVLLSLINGGMRAITGLIGRTSPERVNYRAATATIGIRGTDVTIVTARGEVVVTVTEGAVSFTFAGRTIRIEAGEGVDARTDGTFRQGAAEQIIQQISTDLADLIGGLRGLANAINQAAQGAAGQGVPGQGNTPGGGTGSATGGGNPSPS